MQPVMFVPAQHAMSLLITASDMALTELLVCLTQDLRREHTGVLSADVGDERAASVPGRVLPGAAAAHGDGAVVPVPRGEADCMGPGRHWRHLGPGAGHTRCKGQPEAAGGVVDTDADQPQGAAADRQAPSETYLN